MCIRIDRTCTITHKVTMYKVVRAETLSSLIPVDWRKSQEFKNNGVGHRIVYPLHRLISVPAPGTYLFLKHLDAKHWAQSQGRAQFCPAVLEVTVPRNTQVHIGVDQAGNDVLIAQRVRINRVLETWKYSRWTESQ